MIPNIKPAYYFILIAILFTCSNTEDYYTVEMVDGARTVHNIKPMWGEMPEVELELVQQIGSMDETDENLVMYSIWDTERDDKGNIYILDSGNTRIQKFDRDGEFISTIGREGAGPGEFIDPYNINLDNEGNLFVGDGNGKKILKFDKNGNEIGRIKMNNHRIWFFLRLLGQQKFVLGYALLYVLPGEEDLHNLFTVVDSVGMDEVRFGKPTFIPSGDIEIVHGLLPFDVDYKGDINVAYRYTNEIIKLSSDGNRVLTIYRPVNYELNNEKGEGRNFSWPNTVSMGIAIDNKQRTWVLTLTEQPEEWDRRRFITPKSVARFELFDSEGILLGYVPVPQDIIRMRIKGDRLLIVEGQQVSVFEYRIVEK